MPDRKLFGSIDEFRAAARAQEAPLADASIRASLDTEIKVGAGDSRTLTFTISTPSPDRQADTIAIAGWRLDNFRKNPVVLWAHDAGSLPVAKATKVWIEGDRLMAEAEFTPPGMARFNDTVFDMLKAGFLNATSVGFQPLKYAFTDDPARRFGIDFLEQELLEFSIVPVPANSEALISGKSAGIDVEPMIDWHKASLAKAGLAVVPQARLAAVEALPKKFRGLAKSLPDGAKGARGQFRRVANDIEQALGIAGVAPPAAVETPRLAMARRRLDQVKRGLA